MSNTEAPGDNLLTMIMVSSESATFGGGSFFRAELISRISRLNYRKAGYQPEVTGIERRNGIAEVKRRAANQQVFKCDADAMSSLLSLDLSS